MTDYQVMPPLSADEYTALRADIEQRGVLVPIVRDQHGNLLDGHHRQQICDELGIDCPTDVRHVSDDTEARDVAFTLNLARRHLTREQKRELIAVEIQARPSDSDRAISRRLSCDHKTVGSVRRELSGEIPHPTTLTPAEQREARLMFGLMRARTLAVMARRRNGEHVLFWTLWTADDVDGVSLAAHNEANRLYAGWANSAAETRGVMWDYLDADDELVTAGAS